MQMGCIVTVIRSGLIVSSWGGLSSSCRIAIVCHYSTSILRMNTVMHINVVLKWVFFFFSPPHITLRELPFVFDLLLKVVDSLKLLHLLDIYAKLDLLLGLTRGKFIHKTTTCLESRSSLWSQFSFSRVVWCLSRMSVFFFFLNSTSALFVELIAFTQCQRRSAWLHFCSVCCLFVWGPECFPDILMSNPSYR